MSFPILYIHFLLVKVQRREAFIRIIFCSFTDRNFYCLPWYFGTHLKLATKIENRKLSIDWLLDDNVAMGRQFQIVTENVLSFLKKHYKRASFFLLLLYCVYYTQQKYFLHHRLEWAI